jgi:hypothetical protein
VFALVAVVAVVGFILVKPDESSEKQAKETATTQTTTPAQGTTPTQPEQPPSPPVANIRVRDGKPVGGVQRLEFEKGETAEFFVKSDVADHVHVHGYDLMKDVTPGKPVKFEFKANIDGQFEIELEDRALEIATLRVNP